MSASPDNYRASYDRVAAEYARQFYDEMARKPFDRLMLDWLAARVADTGTICDMGCGPGQIARYLHDQGAAVGGIDFSGAMVQEAQRLHPTIPFQQGDMLALTGVASASFAGIAAFYSIIHIPRPRVVQALNELRRILLPGGALLLTFHIGTGIRQMAEWYGQPVDLDFLFFEREEMKGYLGAAGFMLDEVIERDPYVGVEVETRRAYIFGHKPADPVTEPGSLEDSDDTSG
ncbi:MAG: class I SAM-dependent methyltransferase [Anaerolineales bacterium]|nr:class I SAM-dependent methyltransferase [Anaerolineales bacterium]